MLIHYCVIDCQCQIATHLGDLKQSGLTYVIDKTKATSLDVNSSLPFFLHKMQLNQFLFVSQCDVNNRGWQVVRLSDVQTSCQAPHFNGSFDITAEVCIA